MSMWTGSVDGMSIGDDAKGEEVQMLAAPVFVTFFGPCVSCEHHRHDSMTRPIVVPRWLRHHFALCYWWDMG